MELLSLRMSISDVHTLERSVLQLDQRTRWVTKALRFRLGLARIDCNESFPAPQANMSFPGYGPGRHLDHSGSREVVYCQHCENEWSRDKHGLTCPRCKGDMTEIVSINFLTPLQKELSGILKYLQVNFDSDPRPTSALRPAVMAIMDAIALENNDLSQIVEEQAAMIVKESSKIERS